MSVDLALTQHDTPEELFAALERVFGASESNSTRWVKFEANGVTVTFFAPRSAEPEHLAGGSGV